MNLNAATTSYERRLLAAGLRPLILPVKDSRGNLQGNCVFSHLCALSSEDGTEKVLAYEVNATGDDQNGSYARGDIYVIQILLDDVGLATPVRDLADPLVSNVTLTIDELAAYAYDFMAADPDASSNYATRRAIENATQAGVIDWRRVRGDIIQMIARFKSDDIPFDLHPSIQLSVKLIKPDAGMPDLEYLLINFVTALAEHHWQTAGQ